MAKKQTVRVNINGQEREADVEPRLLLVHFIRDTLGLTGTHVGCDTSNCGACTVVLDGKIREVLHDLCRAGGRSGASYRGGTIAGREAFTRCKRASNKNMVCNAGSARRAC